MMESANLRRLTEVRVPASFAERALTDVASGRVEASLSEDLRCRHL